MAVANGVPRMEQAAACIQQWYRGTRTSALLAQDLSVAHARSIGFVDLTKAMRTRDAITTRKLVTVRLNRAMLRLRPAGTKPNAVRVQVLLGAYVMVLHPGQVFHGINSMEGDIQELAQTYIEMHDDVCDRLRRGLRRTDEPALLDYFGAMYQFHGAWDTWAKPDKAARYERMKRAARALMASLAEVRSSDVDGVANTMRIVESLEWGMQTLCSDAEFAAFKAETRGFVPKGGKPLDEPVRMTNVEIAHSMLIDPAYRIETRMDEAWYDQNVRTQLEQGDMSGILRFMESVRFQCSKLNAALTNMTVNLDAVEALVFARSYGLPQCVNTLNQLTGLAMTLGADSLDYRIEPNVESICSACMRLSPAVSQVLLHRANERIEAIRGMIAAHGVEYERGKFDIRVRTEPGIVEPVRAWLRESVEAAGTIAEAIQAGCVRSACDGVVPATLELDRRQLSEIKRQMDYVTTACSMLAAAQLIGLPALEYRVFSGKAHVEHSREALVKFITALLDEGSTRTGILRVANTECDAYKVMARRVREWLLALVAERPNAASHEVLYIFRARMEVLAKMVRRIATVNLDVHGPRYAQLSTSLAV